MLADDMEKCAGLGLIISSRLVHVQVPRRRGSNASRPTAKIGRDTSPFIIVNERSNFNKTPMNIKREKVREQRAKVLQQEMDASQPILLSKGASKRNTSGQKAAPIERDLLGMSNYTPQPQKSLHHSRSMIGQQIGFDASEILTINVETIEPVISQLLRYVEFLAPTCNLIRSPRVPYSR